jgi:DNA-directed RNA polymerase specialized sigma24 family protein
MVRLADLLGADDPQDNAQEAFARLLRKYDSLRDPDAAPAYVRASVCNLTRNRHRHLRVVRLRTPAGRVFHYPAHVLEPTTGTMRPTC